MIVVSNEAWVHEVWNDSIEGDIGYHVFIEILMTGSCWRWRASFKVAKEKSSLWGG